MGKKFLSFSIQAFKSSFLLKSTVNLYIVEVCCVYVLYDYDNNISL